MQYIAVQYFGDSQKSYTYKCRYRTVKIGDFVVVNVPKGNTVAKVVDVGF